MAYRVYYNDGRMHRGENKPVPARDVQIIVQEHPDIGWHTQCGYDYYIWREEQGRWVGVDLFGLYDFLLDTGLVMFGRTVTQKEFDEVMRHAMDDLRGLKTGWLKSEKKPD
jgi:hypothetical protein